MTARKRLLFAVVGLLALGLAVWCFWPSRQAGLVAGKVLAGASAAVVDFDTSQVLHHNNRGVGYMERFAYADALAEFEQVVALAPAWLPGRINLGIAQLNYGGTTSPEFLTRTRETFERVLALDPDNPHAHHCLGILLMYQKDQAEAMAHFEAVTRIDPGDAGAWFFLGVLCEDPERRSRCFEKALASDPYHVGALYQQALGVARENQARGKELLRVWEALKEAEWGNPSTIKYSEMGKYGEVIGQVGTVPGAGPLPRLVQEPLQVRLAPGAVWAHDGEQTRLTRQVRERFGRTLVYLDYDGDNRPDLFLAGAVRENGQIRDLLLRNTPEGLVDVTRATGLGSAFETLGVCVGDIDNDGRPDLLLTGATGVRLYRNQGNGTFEDITASAGLNTLKGVFLGATLVDLDQDSDLDLVLTRLDPTNPSRGEVLLMLNVGEALPGKTGLSCRFRREKKTTFPPCNGAYVLATDLDGDADLDLVVFPWDGGQPTLLRNERLLRFVADKVPDGWYTSARSLLQAARIDVDLDGKEDVVGISRTGVPVLKQNTGKGLVERHDAFLGCQLERLHALLPVVLEPQRQPLAADLILWSDTGLTRLRPQRMRNQGLVVHLTGRKGVEPGGTSVRCNADGFGAVVLAQVAELVARCECATLSTGLGQSSGGLLLGLGSHERPDVLRIRWPDNTWQAELAPVPPRVLVRQSNRKTTSCPVLFTWDGTRFRFVTDFLGAGTMGEYLPDGTTRPPRPAESVKIEPDQLVPRDGRFLIHLAEPMDEVTYLDQLHLDVIDLPATGQVYPDERFATGGPAPTEALIAFERILRPVRATDQRGRDVTSKLAARDRKCVDGFAHRDWLGLAEEHAVELDFADRLRAVAPGERTFLVLAGWTDYAYPESILAAGQAGVVMQPPILESQDERGQWNKIADVGFPAGLPRVMLLDVTGKIAPKTRRLRIRSNLQVYWDEIYLALGCQEVKPTCRLEVEHAELCSVGIHREIVPDAGLPAEYDSERFDNVPVVRLAGKLTHLGEVTELLRQRDDRFVLFGPGDLVKVAFSARHLPPLPPGWKRHFVLRTHGYCKDTGPFTATGNTIEPLPFAGMRQYPPGGGERVADPAARRVYQREYNTREVPITPPNGPAVAPRPRRPR